MKKKKRGIVQWQSPKTEDVCDSFGNSYLEDPDLLPEQPTAPSSPQLLMGEAVEHLQGRQREVYLLVMREDKSFSEAGEILGVSKATVQTHLDRAIAFISAYCKQSIDRERV